MNKGKEKDILQDLFDVLPKKDLSSSFRTDMMQKIFAEAERIKKREERRTLIWIILTSICMIGLGIALLIYMKIEPVKVAMPEGTSFHFYIFIGILACFLLWIDHHFRQVYKKKHLNETT